MRARSIVLAAADAEEVLDLLAGGVVQLAVAVEARAGEDSLPAVAGGAGHVVDVVASHFHSREPVRVV